MNISSYAQETMCYVGQYLVFEEAEELINNFTGAGFNQCGGQVFPGEAL